MDSKIFWFGFYGHLKMRKFRNFEDFRKLTIFKIFAKSATFFFRIFFAFQWFLELVLRVAGKIEPFFGPKSVFFEKLISLVMKKSRKNWFLPSFFLNIFCFSMNFRTSFTSCKENWTFFRPKKCIFCEMNFAGDKKIQKSWFFPSFFFKWPKKAVKS